MSRAIGRLVTEIEAMERALQLAAAGLARTSPNPSVGAVLIDAAGRVLGEGRTQPVGGPHAEVMALRDAEARGHAVMGATAVVTLEPCCHHGRTPPCTDALLRAGVGRVVVGVRDPNPLVRGRGLQLLHMAGVEVEEGLMAEACGRAILGFARSVSVGLPEVTLKAAISVDGRIATASGESQWITGSMARADGRALRATHDAVLVGRGTLEADDPALTVRDGSTRDPVPVVLDSGLKASASAKVFQGPRRAVFICTTDAPERDLPADIIRVAPASSGRVDVVAAMRALASRGLHRILVEGGGEVHRSLFDAGLVDTLHLYQAGVAIPGGRPWLGGPALERLADGQRMRLADAVRIGDDLRVTWRLDHGIAPLSLALEG